jgi:hypothetical protein
MMSGLGTVGCIAGAAVAAAALAQAQNPPTPTRQTLTRLVERLAEASTAAGKSAAEPAPAGLQEKEKKQHAEHGKWLADASKRLEAAGVKGRNLIKKFGDPPAKEIVDAAKSYSAECLKLQLALEKESRVFNTLSNASKLRQKVLLDILDKLK